MGETEYLQGANRQALLKHLNAAACAYDPKARLTVTGRVRESDYTKIQGRPAHPTRDSIGYACELLEANDPEHRARACDIIRRVLSLQDTNRWSLTYGLWPYYAEEPLGKMFMPDFNWAAFIGKELLYIIIHHDAQLPPDLRSAVRASIRMACECIRRRPLHMGYTNIAAMSSYVTLVAGERLDDPRILAHGRWLFDKWYAYTTRLGSFTEFNSPTYTRVALGDVSRMMADILDPDRREKAMEINRMLWTHLARRFHAPTRQWAGPFSRAYSDLVGPGYVELIQRAFGEAVELLPPGTLGPDIDRWRHPYRGPAELAGYFKPLTEPREEVEVFFRAGDEMPNGLGNRSRRASRISLTGTTYLHPRFALGTVNFLDFWEQHRNLIAHWGTPDKPTYLAMRCVNGNHGFCSAFFAGVQRGGDALAAVVFATDHGNRYIDLDKLRDQTLKTSSLRIEFELGGHLDDARIPDRFDLVRPLVISDRGVSVCLRYLGGTLAGIAPTTSIERRRGRTLLVVHLYRGPQREFHLPSLTEAVCLFGVRFVDAKADGEPVVDAVVEAGDGMRLVRWGDLVLGAPSAPRSVSDLQARIKMSIDRAARE
ncbi:MAG: hypothetical protein JXQ73_14870 [Phycisphaerae bacterium]|nr:hypothetical protein [Phycisphaerae bacterium]